MRRSVASILFTTALIVIFGSAAYAITFGKEVTNPSGKYSSVVSVWVSEDADSEPEFVCTGTLIEPRIVLTAAHCVFEKFFLYYIKYGNDLLDDETELLEVSATWRDPKYSEKQLVNDVGLLLLTEEIDNAITSPLSSEASIKKLLKTKGVKLEIAGWGVNQNKVLATYLRKLNVIDLSSLMAKYRKGWRNDVWMAVGTYNSKEKVFAGACSGDSGGPLFATAGSKTLIVGVTSWGAKDCELQVPSVYARLSYYANRIKSEGINNLLVNEKKKNIALPQVIVEPSIVGTAKVGSTITCDSGKWSDNTSSIVFSWSGPGVPTGSTSATLTLQEASAGSTVICTVTGKSQNGVTERVLNVDIPNPPKVLQPTRIVNMPASDSYKDSNIISCTPAKFSESNTIDTNWWILSAGKPDVRLTQASSTTFNLTLDIITKYAGSKLACQVIANGPSGQVQSNDFQEIRVTEIPRVNSVSVNGISENCGGTDCDWLGITVTCDAATNQSSTSTANFLYSWRVYDLAPWYQSEAPQSREISTGKTLLLTEAILKQASLKRLGCAVTIANSAGTGNGFNAGKYVDYKNISQSDKVAPKFSLLSTSSTVRSGGTDIDFRIEISDEFDTGLEPISGVRLVGPKFNDIKVDWNQARESGDAKKGIYLLSFQLPNESSGGLSGEYGLVVLISDSKQNSTGWRQLTSFNYTPTPTPTPTPKPTFTKDTKAPVIVTDGPPGVSPPGGNFYVQFKATDDIAVTSAKAVLIKSGLEISTTSCPSHTSIPDFYLCRISLPSNATRDGYSLRFEAFDSAGNIGSATLLHSTITDRPVYIGGATITKSGNSDVSVGDVFTCDVGTWLYTNDSFFPITCEWVTSSGGYRGKSLTLTSAMISGPTYYVRVALRVNNGAPITGAWGAWYVAVGDGLYELSTGSDFFEKTYSKTLAPINQIDFTVTSDGLNRVVSLAAGTQIPAGAEITLRWPNDEFGKPACTTEGANFDWTVNCHKQWGASIWEGSATYSGYPQANQFTLEPLTNSPGAYQARLSGTVRTGYRVATTGSLIAVTITTTSGQQWASKWKSIP